MDAAQIKAMVKPIIVSSLPAGWMCPDAEILREPDRHTSSSAGRTAIAA